MATQRGAEQGGARGWIVFELLFAALAVACAWPLVQASYPPIQDLPQHLAAIRVLHDHGDPALGFARFFELDLLATQYLAYYLTADLLAHLVGVEPANRVLVITSVVATPYALRSLLDALGKDGRMALLAFPLSYNAHLILGFLNFLAAIPLMLWGLALAVRQRRNPRTGRAVGIAVLALVCFYTHVVPFALLGLGAGLIALTRDPKALARGLAPLLPATVAGAAWALRSPAGQATVTAARGSDSGPEPVFLPAAAALERVPMWMTDVLRGDVDRALLWAWAGLALAALVAGAVQHVRSHEPRDGVGATIGWRLALLSPLCVLLYFVMPTSYDWIWPIAPRFPLLAAVLVPILLPRSSELFARGVLVGAFVISAASFYHVGDAFADFETEEVGDFDEALAHIPAGQKVAGLIFARGSRHVSFSPFIHYVAYYQARKGGAVMFTFADFPQSPFRFVAHNRPPRVPPRWEWMPQRVRPRQLTWYDYVLVRGGPGAVARPGSGFELRYGGRRWSVYGRVGLR